MLRRRGPKLGVWKWVIAGSRGEKALLPSSMASTGNARKFCCIHFRAVFFLHRDSHAELASHHIEV
jgi:hypothetical protein